MVTAQQHAGGVARESGGKVVRQPNADSVLVAGGQLQGPAG